MHFLELQLNVLRCIGIFPLDATSKWKLWTFNVYRSIVFIILTAFTVLMTVQVFVSPDLSILAGTIDVWTMFFSGWYKWFMMTMSNDDFAKVRTDLLEIQCQGSVAYGGSANHFTEKYLKRTKKMALWYLSFGMITAFIMSGSPFFTSPKNGRTDTEYYNDPKTYPFLLWIPLKINDYWIFLLLFTLHFLSAILIATLYLGIDSFMFGAIYNVGGQIDLLNKSINNIENAMSTVENSLHLNPEAVLSSKQNIKCYSILRECTKHHILIFRCIKKINAIFSSLIFIDYIHGTISLTFALFQLTFSGGISETINVMFFFGLSFSHQYLNNFFGEFIIQKQLSVRSSLYNVSWWRADKKVRFILSLMILRSMRPTVIAGCNLYKLCHETFLKFSKGLYTYYMVLRRINMEDNN